jgi:CheY-like chemotaxis protein
MALLTLLRRYTDSLRSDARIEQAGHQVMEAPHGAAALDIISPSRLPDVVMTDLTMRAVAGRGMRPTLTVSSAASISSRDRRPAAET